MNISQWPINKIMQLPDWCFGQRWPITLSVKGTVPVPDFVISLQGLPDVCVIWEVGWWAAKAAVLEGLFQLRIGDQLPTTWAEFLENDLLLPQATPSVRSSGDFLGQVGMVCRISNIRYLLSAQGRRVILGCGANLFIDVELQVVVVVSSIPTEVPDWLVSR